MNQEQKERRRKYKQQYEQRPEVKEMRKRYRQRPEVKEQMSEQKKEYRQRPEVKENDRQWRQLNKKQLLIQKKEYYQLNKDKIKENRRQYSQRPEKRDDIKKNSEEYQKANKDGLIYTITNPIGHVYIGCTKMLPNLRWNGHKRKFKNKPGSLPLLHKSFEKWGVDTHLFSVIENHGNISKKELFKIETNMIINLKSNGKSLNIYPKCTKLN